MSRTEFFGTGVAVVTPFKEDFSVDYDALANNIHYLIDNGIKYLVALGTTAESPTITTDEKIKIFDCFKQVNNNRVPLVMGMGGNHTAALQEALRTAEVGGFQAILSVSPYYNRPSQEGIYRHYKALDAVTPLPMIVYNVPGRTASNISAETTLRIAHDCKNIIGIKEASGDLEQGAQILAGRPKDFLVLSGDDATAVSLIQIGAEGVISVVAGGFPKTFSKGIDAALNSEKSIASEVMNQMNPVIDLLYEEGNPAGIKAVLHQRGLLENHLRLPLISATDDLQKRLQVVTNLLD
jgi:4-hydroxy-tetrahydrodipicolinate synthase